MRSALPPACQVELSAPGQDSTGALGALFAEELGLVLEVAPEYEEAVCAAYASRGLPAVALGCVAADGAVSISVGGEPSISGAFRILPLSTPLKAVLHVDLSTHPNVDEVTPTVVGGGAHRPVFFTAGFRGCRRSHTPSSRDFKDTTVSDGQWCLFCCHTQR